MERWAMGKGLAALLVTLSPQYDHLLQGAKRADYTPANKTTEEISRAYRKAMHALHPDRQSQSSDSHAAEAEEVLKYLTEAHADEGHWLDGIVEDSPPRDTREGYSSSSEPPPPPRYAPPPPPPKPWKPSSAKEEKLWDSSKWKPPNLKTMNTVRRASGGEAMAAASSAQHAAPEAPADDYDAAPFDVSDADAAAENGAAYSFSAAASSYSYNYSGQSSPQTEYRQQQQPPAQPRYRPSSSSGGLAAGLSSCQPNGKKRGSSKGAGLAAGLASCQQGGGARAAPAPYRSTAAPLAKGTVLTRGTSSASGIADGLSSLNGGGAAGGGGGIADGTVLTGTPRTKGWPKILSWLNR